MKLCEALKLDLKNYSKLFNTVLFDDIWWPKYEAQPEPTDEHEPLHCETSRTEWQLLFNIM